jgi:type II secretory pathway component GspD/PulD (secretin)
VRRDLHLSAGLNFSDVLSLLDEAGAATVRNAPRILTLNNRTASILDGERVTYVTRYSGYNDLFKTDSMDAGLALTVLPSLGESGYITLRINAELTSLGNSKISGSPVKEGQMVENTVIVKDGESILLGGLSRSVDQTVKKRFPILGHVLPFLFSREITIKENFESLIILTPTVVDFATALDEETMGLIEGK